MKFVNSLGAALLLASCSTMEEIVRDIPNASPPTGTASAPAPVSPPAAKTAVLIASPVSEVTYASPMSEMILSPGDIRYTQTSEGVWNRFDIGGRNIATYTVVGTKPEWIELAQSGAAEKTRFNVKTRAIIDIAADGKETHAGTIQSMSVGPVVNGANVTWVGFATGAAKFVQTDDKTWTEFGGDGRAMDKFNETMRDEWSVYLETPDGGKKIQLDLYRRMIGLGTGGPVSDYMPILTAEFPVPESSSPLPINGFTAKRVLFDGGKQALAYHNAGEWVAYRNGRVEGMYAIAFISVDSVSLRDKRDGSRIDLNTKLKALQYRDGKPDVPVEEIQTVASGPNGGQLAPEAAQRDRVKKVVFGKGSQLLIDEGERGWVLYDGGGRVDHELIRREGNGLLLRNKNRGSALRVDIEKRMVQRDYGGRWIDAYRIDDMSNTGGE